MDAAIVWPWAVLARAPWKKVAAASVAAAAAAGGLAYGVFVGPGGPGAPPPPPPSSETANLYMSPTAGTDTCARSSTPITYTSAVSANAVCKSWWKACSAATAGDTVGVKNGTYPTKAATTAGIPNILYNGDDGFGNDCSDGSGADYNPNWREQGVAEASLANWVTFVCADGDTQDGVIMGAGHFRVGANAHARVYGGCFHFSNILLNYQGESIRGAKNVIWEGRTNRLRADAIASYGGMNVMWKFWETGPHTICGQDNGPEPEAAQCSQPTPVWEAKYANRAQGNSDFEGGGQPPKFSQSSSHRTTNARSEDAWIHDLMSKDGQAPAPDWHGGCGMAQFNKGTSNDGTNASQAHNIVVDRTLCERVMVFGFFIEDADGVTYQNGMTACPTDLYQNNNYQWWSTCVAGQPSFSIKSGTSGWTPTNILVRYNSFYSGLIMGSYGSYSNVRVIGNVSVNGGCEAGVFFDRNAWTNANSCTDGTVLSSQGNPWVQNTYTNFPNPPTLAQVQTREVDFHLTSGAKSFENWIGETSSDYALGYDFDGQTRSAPRDAGADER